MTRLGDLLKIKPVPAGIVLQRLAFGTSEEDMLVRQVIALANADVSGPRCLIFGAERNAAGRVSVCGIPTDDVQQVERQRLTCLDAIEPAPDLRLVTGKLAGRQLVALVLEDCRNPPYLASGRGPAALRAGECWLAHAHGMRTATRSDLDLMYARRKPLQDQQILVGLGTDPLCRTGELPVPRANSAPSRIASRKLRSAIAARKTVSSVMGHDDTALARLVDARIFGADFPHKQQGMNTLVMSLRAVADDYRNEDLRYRFEEAAARLNLCIRNDSAQPLRDAVIEVTLPLARGLEVAEQFFGPAEEQRFYPEVFRKGNVICARAPLGTLLPGRATTAFGTALRLSIDERLIGRKVAVHYVLTASNLAQAVQGRLKTQLT